MKPLLRVPERYRDAEPWSLLTEQMTGEHQWKADSVIHDQDSILIMDRNGSYPSACSSTPLVPNRLVHTGPMTAQETIGRAGIFRVTGGALKTSNLPHPLGRYGDRGDQEPKWITTPHLLLLNRLVKAKIIKSYKIVDSWTGKRTDGLLSHFSKEVQKERLASLECPERYEEVKKSSSIALRLLWSQSQSPFYRPDWSVSVRAEAAVRHWLRAWQVTTTPQDHPCSLLRLGNVDEVAVLVPGGLAEDEKNWVPAPYVLGQRYGQIKVKAQLSGKEWKVGQK